MIDISAISIEDSGIVGWKCWLCAEVKTSVILVPDTERMVRTLLAIPQWTDDDKHICSDCWADITRTIVNMRSPHRLQ